MREKILDIAGHKCSICSSNDRLQVHHARYTVSGESIRFKETVNDLIVLCHDCHTLFHRFRKGGGNLDGERCRQIAALLAEGLCREDAFFRGLSYKRFDGVMKRLKDGHGLPSPKNAERLARSGERRMYREDAWREAKKKDPTLQRRGFRVEYPEHLQTPAAKKRAARAKQNTTTPHRPRTPAHPIDTVNLLHASVVGFNGTKRPDYTSPLTFFNSYISFMRGKNDIAAVQLAEENHDWILAKAAQFIETRERKQSLSKPTTITPSSASSKPKKSMRQVPPSSQTSELWRTAYDIPLDYYLQRDD